MIEYKDFPFSTPDPDRKVPVEKQKEEYIKYKHLKEALLLKAETKLGKEDGNIWYSTVLDNYKRRLLTAGYNYTEMSYTLAYHPIVNSTVTEDFIYRIDFEGNLSVLNFLKDSEQILDNM